MSIMDKLKKNSKIKETSTLSTSRFFTEKDMVPTDVPMVNVALSGSVNGGISPGLTVLAGPSKHFKTSFRSTRHLTLAPWSTSNYRRNYNLVRPSTHFASPTPGKSLLASIP